MRIGSLSLGHFHLLASEETCLLPSEAPLIAPPHAAALFSLQSSRFILLSPPFTISLTDRMGPATGALLWPVRPDLHGPEWKT